ncbi:hypothetical protein M427DRAFT_152900 [Gonapodya prolifera JEL478]|uniref:Pre-mRNA-splicing factor cwc2 n=1 Tax=Gonapodya prolifera (strain JEL478) TaxID=1344416 RepID=A0A139AR32_GONPJ|nr:hypothetical protein M427DRAFT_152900 [Gonapodya prolifera JEL478]|eukprot:KXS18955.1 hypothetical protein M427DRAFT_152900 [Gonapodya prolifera JEL478]
MNRPAPPQMDTATARANGPSKHADAGIGDRSTQYNIWYNRWLGDLDRKKGGPIERAPSRCYPLQDTGYTKGSQERPNSCLFCVHFAHGCCTKGVECPYLHRVPRVEDEKRWPRAEDCFGRSKHDENRDDMGGTGSFLKDSRTLYMNRIAPYKDIKTVVIKHYSEFGEIEHVNILPSKNVAFVRFRSRLQAEFAKEAMFGQSLDSNEILNVRWATADPHMDRRLKGMMDEVEHGLRAEEEEQAPQEDEDGRETKRRRVEYRAEGKYGTGTIVGTMEIGGYEDNDEGDDVRGQNNHEQPLQESGGSIEPATVPAPQPINSLIWAGNAASNQPPSAPHNMLQDTPSPIVSTSTLAFLRQMTEKMKTAGVKVDMSFPSGSGGQTAGSNGLGMLAGYDSDDDE